MVTSSFDSLNLHPKLLRAVKSCGFTDPTPIQSQAIPEVMAGKDVMASAQTGTGKTAAFVLPSLQRLMIPSPRKGRGPRILVLTPTRELALQINADIGKLGRYCSLRFGSLLGGMAYGPQIKLLQSPVDFLVATPGRLIDHMRAGRLDFSRLEVFVLDEADRMLDMGFIGDVRQVAAKLPKHRQSLLFSATLEGPVLNIARALLQDPVRVQLTANTKPHEMIQQSIYHADTLDHKHQLLVRYIVEKDLSQALIFTSTKRDADRLARALTRQGHDTATLHGDMSQSARRRTVEQMRRGELKLIVATDVAARGLDIRTITHVINFDLPRTGEDYIHRIGRTGRAGDIGTAISIVGPQDWPRLAGIERTTGHALERAVFPGLEPRTSEPRMGTRSSGRTWKPGKRRGSPARRRQRMSSARS